LDVIHLSATDDFGTPILVEAKRNNVSPQEFVNHWNQRDRKDFADLGISFDIFYKTSSTENRELTQHFFKKLYEKGFIYEQSVGQPFCEKCQRFLPDRYIKGTCPHCGATEQYSDSCENCGRTIQTGEILDPHCVTCGSKPVQKQSEHYFFRLSQFSEQLERWLIENKNLQIDVKNYVLNWVKEGLKDWDISRDIRWGIPVPLKEAEGKVLYVWFNNHIGYIATAQKYFAERGIDGKQVWNSSKLYHFIGKDIVYHHYLYLPAMRMGEGDFKLPDYIPTRGYFTLEGRKFSKSREWFIGVREFLNKYPSDYLRFYLAIITPYSQADVNFDWKEFQERINKELIDNIGNFIHRVLTFTWNNYAGIIPELGAQSQLDKELLENLKIAVDDVSKEIDQIELNKGLKKIIKFTTFCNQYFQKKAPWKDKDEAKTTIYLCINAVRSLAILLEPYIPFSTEKLWQQLNLKGSVHKQAWNSTKTLKLSKGHKINQPQVLFEKVQINQSVALSND
jgi:methionyl-tRNA synthetase